jgi:hypothetical protein
MYSDQDGSATAQSQAEYDHRIRRLVFATSLLSWLAFVAAVLNHEFTEKYLDEPVSLKAGSFLSLSQFLWVSFPAHTTYTVHFGH